MLSQQSKIDAVHDVTEAPLIGTHTLSIASTKDDLINMLAVDFAFLLCLFEKFFGTVFGTLFLATLRRLYLLARWRVVTQTFSIRSSKVLVEDCQLNIDILLVLQHPALNSFFDLFPTAFVVNLDRKIIGDVNSS